MCVVGQLVGGMGRSRCRARAQCLARLLALKLSKYAPHPPTPHWGGWLPRAWGGSRPSGGRVGGRAARKSRADNSSSQRSLAPEAEWQRMPQTRRVGCSRHTQFSCQAALVALQSHPTPPPNPPLGWLALPRLGRRLPRGGGWVGGARTACADSSSSSQGSAPPPSLPRALALWQQQRTGGWGTSRAAEAVGRVGRWGRRRWAAAFERLRPRTRPPAPSRPRPHTRSAGSACCTSPLRQHQQQQGGERVGAPRRACARRWGQSARPRGGCTSTVPSLGTCTQRSWLTSSGAPSAAGSRLQVVCGVCARLLCVC